MGKHDTLQTLWYLTASAGIRLEAEERRRMEVHLEQQVLKQQQEAARVIKRLELALSDARHALEAQHTEHQVCRSASSAVYTDSQRFEMLYINK